MDPLRSTRVITFISSFMSLGSNLSQVRDVNFLLNIKLPSYDTQFKDSFPGERSWEQAGLRKFYFLSFHYFYFSMYSLFYFNIIPLGLSSKYIIFIVILLSSQLILASLFTIIFVLIHAIILCSHLVVSSPFILCCLGNLITHSFTSLYLNSLVRSLRNHTFSFPS